jgi:hypothetical protein
MFIYLTPEIHKSLCEFFSIDYRPLEFDPIECEDNEPEPWNKGMKLDFVPKSETHKANLKKSWVKRKQEGKVIQEKTYIASLKKRRENSKRYDFIHTDGREDHNLTVVEMCEKYKNESLHPSNLRKAKGCGPFGYLKCKGWRINNYDVEYFTPRKVDKRTMRKNNE